MAKADVVVARVVIVAMVGGIITWL